MVQLAQWVATFPTELFTNNLSGTVQCDPSAPRCTLTAPKQIINTQMILFQYRNKRKGSLLIPYTHTYTHVHTYSYCSITSRDCYHLVTFIIWICAMLSMLYMCYHASFHLFCILHHGMSFWYYIYIYVVCLACFHVAF